MLWGNSWPCQKKHAPHFPIDGFWNSWGTERGGESQVTKVEVSTDGGQTWVQARLLDASIRHTWRLWEYDWHTPPKPGSYTVMARATDAGDRVQPMQRDSDRRSYMISHVLPINVEVR